MSWRSHMLSMRWASATGQGCDCRWQSSADVLVDFRRADPARHSVPVYADATPEEMAAVIEDAEVKIAAVQDQEQVDKFVSASERLSFVKYVVYDEDRGLEDYDHTRLKPMHGMIEEAKALFARDPSERARIVSKIEAGQGGDTSIMAFILRARRAARRA